MSVREPFAPDSNVLPFRRRSTAVRVRRPSPWRALAAPLVRALLVVGLPVALGLWLFTSPTFALARIEVAGNQRVDARWIEGALGPLRGENLLLLPLERVERTVGEHPWVARVSVEKRLPDGLQLTLEERRPAALLRAAEGLVVIDAGGRPIAPYRFDLEPGLLLVSIGVRGEVDLGGALAVADELERAAPDWAATLSEVTALAEEDFRLDLGALDFPLFVRAGTLAARLPELRRLLPELERRYPALAGVDLRFERRIVFQPVLQPNAERS
jgi:cell division protein FtsQ